MYIYSTVSICLYDTDHDFLIFPKTHLPLFGVVFFNQSKNNQKTHISTFKMWFLHAMLVSFEQNFPHNLIFHVKYLEKYLKSTCI